MSSSNCCFLTCIHISQETGQVVWYSHLFQNFLQFIVIHTVKGFGIVNKAEIRCFSGTLLLFWWCQHPLDVGNLISGSSAFAKTSLNIWKFMGHVLLKPGMENFKHYFTSVWDECNCMVVWAFLALPFFGIGMKTDLFQSCQLLYDNYTIKFMVYDNCLTIPQELPGKCTKKVFLGKPGPCFIISF